MASFATAQDLELKVTVVTPSSVVDSAVVIVAGGRITSVSAGALAGRDTRLTSRATAATSIE
jgi:hypothetical protein